MPHTLWLNPMYTRMILIAIVVVAAAYYFSSQAMRPIVSSECTTDGECDTGGCSGQICTTAERAPTVITTCEYREEYGCLQLTSCGCVDGTCAWRNTTPFNECMANLTR